MRSRPRRVASVTNGGTFASRSLRPLELSVTRGRLSTSDPVPGPGLFFDAHVTVDPDSDDVELGDFDGGATTRVRFLELW